MIRGDNLNTGHGADVSHLSPPRTQSGAVARLPIRHIAAAGDRHVTMGGFCGLICYVCHSAGAKVEVNETNMLANLLGWRIFSAQFVKFP